jgi:hypothetical protein
MLPRPFLLPTPCSCPSPGFSEPGDPTSGATRHTTLSTSSVPATLVHPPGKISPTRPTPPPTRNHSRHCHPVTRSPVYRNQPSRSTHVELCRATKVEGNGLAVKINCRIGEVCNRRRRCVFANACNHGSREVQLEHF